MTCLLTRRFARTVVAGQRLLASTDPDYSAARLFVHDNYADATGKSQNVCLLDATSVLIEVRVSSSTEPPSTRERIPTEITNLDEPDVIPNNGGEVPFTIA